MAGAGHQTLDQQVAVAEGGGCLRLAALECFGELIFGCDHSHAATASACDCLEHHRAAVAERAVKLGRCVEVDGGLGTGQDGDVEFDSKRAGLGLVAEQLE